MGIEREKRGHVESVICVKVDARSLFKSELSASYRLAS